MRTALTLMLGMMTNKILGIKTTSRLKTKKCLMLRMTTAIMFGMKTTLRMR